MFKQKEFYRFDLIIFNSSPLPSFNPLKPFRFSELRRFFRFPELVAGCSAPCLLLPSTLPILGFWHCRARRSLSRKAGARFVTEIIPQSGVPQPSTSSSSSSSSIHSYTGACGPSFLYITARRIPEINPSI